MGEDRGNGESITGFTRYVTLSEFDKYCGQNDKDHAHINKALWGAEGTNGLIKDIHDLKMWIKFLGIAGGVISPLLTAYLIKLLMEA